MLTRKVGLIAAGALVVAAAAWFVFSPSHGTKEDIETVTVDRGDIVRSIATSGTVSPLVTVEVGSQVSGLVSALYADFNSPVKAGQIVAQIDPKQFEQRVTQAKADLSVAEANIDVQKANITKADAKLNQLKRELDRNKKLREQGNVSISALDTAQANYDAAVADVETSKAQLRTAQATLIQRQAALSNAQIDLGYTEIKSPIDGIVIERAVDVGQTVAATMQAPVLFRIAQDLSKIQIEASVDEADIGGVKNGDVTNFTVDAYPERKFQGKVTQVRLAPEESQSVVTYTVIISADNPSQVLLPGMTANVEIITGKRSNVLRLKNEALRFRAPDSWTGGEANARPAGFPGPGGFGPRPNGQRPANFGGANNMLNDLPFKLTDEQRDSIQKAMAAQFESMRGSFGNGGSFDPQAMRAQMQQRIEDVMSRYLTDDQFKQFKEFQAERASETTTNVWVIDADGKPQREFARLGITDNRYTEIAGGPLKEGDKVVSRVTQTSED